MAKRSKMLYQLFILTLLVFSIIIPVNQKAFSNSIYFPWKNRVYHPGLDNFLISKKEILLKNRNNKVIENSKTFIYYNGDRSIAKIDIYYANRVYNTKIFLQKRGKIFRIIEYAFKNKKRYKLVENFIYNSKGHLIETVKKYASGLKLKKRRIPLVVLQRKYSYDSGGRLTKITKRYLREYTYSFEAEYHEIPKYDLFNPIEELRYEIQQKEYHFSYNSGGDFPSKRIVLEGVPGNLMIIHVEKIEKKNGEENYSFFIPGADFKTHIRKKYSGNKLILFNKELFFKDDLYKEIEQKYEENFRFLNYSREKSFESGDEEISDWVFEYQKLTLKSRKKDEDKIIKDFPVRANRKTNDKVDRVMQLSYDQWGNLTEESIYRVLPKKKKRLISRKRYSYKYVRPRR